MKIGYDHTIFNFHKTGIGYYTYFLFNNLIDRYVDIELFGYNGLKFTEINKNNLQAESSLNRNVISAGNRLRNIRLARLAYRKIKFSFFKSASRNLELFHATNFLPPARCDIPTLPLVHDVSHLRHPEWHPHERVSWLTGRSEEISNAPLVNTVSQFSATEINRTLNVPLEKIRITYPGINPRYHGEPEGQLDTLARFDLQSGSYFLCVGTLEPRKNLTTVIAAYAGLAETVQKRYPLLVAGPSGWGDMDLPEAANHLVRQGRLRFTGYIDEVAMHGLYCNATAFLFPSVYEGFGMPVSEAMATGTRPVISRGSAPEEIVAGLGLVLAGTDVDAWKSSMLAAIEEQWHRDSSLRERLVKQSANFSWAQTAEQTRSIYCELLELENRNNHSERLHCKPSTKLDRST